MAALHLEVPAVVAVLAVVAVPAVVTVPAVVAVPEETTETTTRPRRKEEGVERQLHVYTAK